MPKLNKVFEIGYMTADPELKQTPSGVSTCSFSIGVQRDYKNADGTFGTDFFNVVTWRNTAEFVSKYFRKGSCIFVGGRLSTRNYTARDGHKVYITEITADEVQFMTPKADTAARSTSNTGPGEQYKKAEQAPLDDDLPPLPKPPDFEALDPEADLPF